MSVSTLLTLGGGHKKTLRVGWGRAREKVSSGHARAAVLLSSWHLQSPIQDLPMIKLVNILAWSGNRLMSPYPGLKSYIWIKQFVGGESVSFNDVAPGRSAMLQWVTLHLGLCGQHKLGH